MKIAICGDSFAADYRLEHPSYAGWPVSLGRSLTATIVSFGLAGASEFRVLKQVECVAERDDLDLVVVAHTSPYRIYTRAHPLRAKDPLHYSSDFVVRDTLQRKLYYWGNPHVKAARLYYKYLLDEEQSLTVHRLLCAKIEDLGSQLDCPVLHTSGFDYTDVFEFRSWFEMHDVAQANPGPINHMSRAGNRRVLARILARHASALDTQ